MKAVFPLHTIETFTHSIAENEIYVNDLSTHLRENEFIMHAHKHDFYCVIFCIAGAGLHEIDFVTHAAKSRSIYFMHPGQEHRVISKSNLTEGYVFFHTRAYYEMGFNGRSIRDFPFYYCTFNAPHLVLDPETAGEISDYCKKLLREYRSSEAGKHQTICSLLDLIYINLGREYRRVYSPKHVTPASPTRVRRFEQLVEKNFLRAKSPAQYADMMKMSTKQLNRLCREAFGKTTSDIILERIILEAKRELLLKQKNVSEVAAKLGYFDTGYFSRIFRKKTSMSPSEFVKAHDIRLTAG